MKVVAEFVTSAAGANGLPTDGLPEIAMVGRSNVGKSSLINALVRKKLARTSAAPGKTRLANFFRVSAEPRPPFYLVDLPGFGYARGGDKAREEFDALAAEYFGARVNDPRFRGVFVLVDSRHPGLDSDRATWNWLDSHDVTYYAVAVEPVPRGAIAVEAGMPAVDEHEHAAKDRIVDARA
ncbi:MAG TPA: ribosome biogenesis GTP-binding protein YihA/YsxC, partial [Thermoanaerobaculia bacterium]|nr:ribosome biogenesis GTP-binding protein YihA/YsxC [Thermoanaerobaculia bacterium]